MKKTVIIFSLFFALNLYGQNTRMWVGEKNGKVLSYPIDSIEKITFIKNSPSWKYNAMDVFSRQTIPYHGVYRVNPTNTITFNSDTLIISDPIMFAQKYPVHGYMPHPVPIDSITFSFFQKDTNILEVSAKDTFWCSHPFVDYGSYQCALWLHNRIYFSDPYGYLEIDSSFKIIKDSTYCPELKSGLTFAANSESTKLLSIDRRQFAYDENVSVGYLIESDIQNGNSSKFLGMLDSGISSAIYFGKDTIIYYSYGNILSVEDKSADAGYYLFDRITGKNTLICHFLSDIGALEMINGFDISPDGKKILIPSVGIRIPYLIEYDILTHVFDTLRIPFTPSNNRNGLWLRYNHDGSKILYCNYAPAKLLGLATSEIGIIDRKSLSKKIVSTNPTNEGRWICLFPNWSPDEKKIVCCAATILREPAGYLGSFEICILKMF